MLGEGLEGQIEEYEPKFDNACGVAQPDLIFTGKSRLTPTAAKARA